MKVKSSIVLQNFLSYAKFPETKIWITESVLDSSDILALLNRNLQLSFLFRHYLNPWSTRFLIIIVNVKIYLTLTIIISLPKTVYCCRKQRILLPLLRIIIAHSPWKVKDEDLPGQVKRIYFYRKYHRISEIYWNTACSMV